MIQEEYYDAYQNNNNHPFHIALEDNDLLDFVPSSAMQIIHCTPIIRWKIERDILMRRVRDRVTKDIRKHLLALPH